MSRDDPAATGEPARFDGLACPLPIRERPRVVAGHGGGGRLTAELVDGLFRPAFGPDPGDAAHDAARLDLPSGRLAFTTDSYVVQPLFFPGGSIGDLAVNGTVNDLAMAGAVPVALSVGFILEEGLELDVLAEVAAAMGNAARNAGVRLVTGDTKVVEHGHGDGCYVNTAGIGTVPDGIDLRPARVRPGDRVLVSGPLGRHGIAVLSRRAGIAFGTEVTSDTRPLAELVASILRAFPDVHVLRDPTRGGLAATLCEIAEAAGCGVAYDEAALPVPPEVASACALLGLDPTVVANEGVLVAFVPDEGADAVLAAMRAHPDGAGAVAIGVATGEHPGTVVARTALGTRRVVEHPLGEELPRIC